MINLFRESSYRQTDRDVDKENEREIRPTKESEIGVRGTREELDRQIDLNIGPKPERGRRKKETKIYRGDK